MALKSYTSEDESAKITIDTDTWEVTLIDLIADKEENAPLLEEDASALDGMLVPGFKNGKIMLAVAKYIKNALT